MANEPVPQIAPKRRSLWLVKLEHLWERLVDAFDGTSSAMFWSGLVAAGCGLILAKTNGPTEVTPIVWDAAAFGLLFGTLIFGASLLGFLATFVHTERAPHGLHTVMRQGVHDTGALAREAAVDAALRDEDEGGGEPPQFED
jgi:hypothetical protein